MRKFAWWPTRMSNGKLTWLAYFWHYQYLYDATTGRPPLWGRHFEYLETDMEHTFRLLKESVIHNRNTWNDVELTKQDQHARNFM